MATYKSMALAVILALAVGCEAFVQPKLSNAVVSCDNGSNTCLHAFTPPTMIIGPMIRKMREEQAKKRMPMATDEERQSEAPGLRVGTGAWKWPPVWPFEEDLFKRKDEIITPAANPMAMLSGGMPPLPMSTGDLPDTEANKLDVLKYWGEEKSEVTTDLNEETAERLRNHYSYYLRDGMSVLELGAAENSYLPENLKLSRHVGVGASQPLMEKNPSLTETLVVDLNNVVEGVDVDSNELRGLGANTFDAIIMANTIDFLTSPREVFRSTWRLLKPGGVMIVSFVSKDAYRDKFEKAQTKMWQDMNDDQHLWIAGSFFQFSAGDGWEYLKGFDISPPDARRDSSPLGSLLNKNKPVGIYVVQACKGYQDESIDDLDPEKSFRSKMWMIPTLEERDKSLVAPRLARSYFAADSDEDGRRIAENVETLPKIYESLLKMDQFAFTFSMQAQLAADLVSDPGFVANEEQITALKMGLGLRTPSESFWAPVGRATASMTAEDKINLLSYIVPRFGSGDPAQEAALEAFVSGLEPTFSVIRAKCPSMSEGDVQLVGSELLACEILKPGRSTREEFAKWVGALTDSEVREILSKRKNFKENSVAEMKAMQAERKAEMERIEAERKRMQEQLEAARQQRTVVFNPKTGKMEEVKKR